tara:strand:+ start:824 stop:958 length:135 start_codon:yes stop_codon:yes gene_type:complete
MFDLEEEKGYNESIQKKAAQLVLQSVSKTLRETFDYNNVGDNKQ